MFRGNHQTRVDEKFRLKLPSDYKRRVDQAYSGEFYITSLNGKRAQIYPMREWEAIEAEICRLPITDPERTKFLDVTNYYGQTVELDAQGRLILPQVIRQTAKLTGEVNVLGCQTYLEVVNIEMFETELKGDGGLVEMPKESLAALAEKTKALRG